MFKGHYIEAPVKTFILTERITLHNVLQYDKNYGERPCEVLVRTVLTHAMLIAEMNTIIRLENWLSKLVPLDNIVKKLPYSPEKIIINTCLNHGFKDSYIPIDSSEDNDTDDMLKVINGKQQ